MLGVSGDAQPSRRTVGRRGLQFLAIAVSVAFGIGVVTLATGGGALSVGGVTLAARSATRPFIVGSILAALLFTVVVKSSARSERPRLVVRTLVVVGFLTLFWAIAGIALPSLDPACGGLDSYAYVSAAQLIRAGRLSQAEPLAAALPFQNAIDALSPLGYRPSPDRSTIVPTFPIGFPLVMAAVMALVGDGGAFYVPFVLGMGTVVLTYLLARQLMPAAGAALAAVLVATNPVFVNEAIQPMSDVPATFWTVAAVYAISRARPLPLVAGFAAGMAVLTRPPLLLPAIVIGWLAGRHGRRSVLLYVSGLLPVFVLLAAIQARLYGSPWVSGHGSAGQLFTLEVVARNAWHHLKWLTVVHTPLIFPAFALGLVLRDRRFALLALWLFATVAAPYLLYFIVFDDWEMLRFLLPGLVFVLIVAANGVFAAAERLRPRLMMEPLILALAVGIALGSYAFAARHNVSALKYNEAKFPLVGWWLNTNAPPNAVVLASLHSGSIRFYAGRTTLRFDAIPATQLEPTVIALRRQGYACYLVLDGPSEVKQFRGHFADADLNGIVMAQEGRVRDIDIFKLDAKTMP